MDGPDSRTDNYSIIFRALLQPQFASKRPLLSHMDITGRQNWRTESTHLGRSPQLSRSAASVTTG